MPVYEYVCATCDERFSRIRTMAEADEPMTCEAGHRARRALSVFARSAASSSAEAGAGASVGGGGGCCGGGCGCG